VLALRAAGRSLIALCVAAHHASNHRATVNGEGDAAPHAPAAGLGA